MCYRKSSYRFFFLHVQNFFIKPYRLNNLNRFVHNMKISKFYFFPQPLSKETLKYLVLLSMHVQKHLERLADPVIMGKLKKNCFMKIILYNLDPRFQLCSCFPHIVVNFCSQVALLLFQSSLPLYSQWTEGAQTLLPLPLTAQPLFFVSPPSVCTAAVTSKY